MDWKTEPRNRVSIAGIIAFSSPKCPDRLWGKPSLYLMGTDGAVSSGKAENKKCGLAVIISSLSVHFVHICKATGQKPRQ